MSDRTLTVIDPRSSMAVSRASVAARPSSLDRQRVLLLDNGKLDPSFGGYAAVFEVLRRVLVDDGHAVVESDTAHLLDHTLEDLRVLAEKISGSGVAAAVLAMCDTGISMPTVVLATELEARGVATVAVCHGIGYTTARATVDRLLPGMPLVELRSDRTAPVDAVRAELLDGAADAVLRGLLASAESPTGTGSGRRSVPSRHLELPVDDAVAAFTVRLRESGFGDGLLFTPPTPERVAAMVAAMGEPADAEIWPALIPRGAPVTVEDIAVVAVMAGCTPVLGRLVLAAYRAMAEDEFRLFQAAITTHPSGTLVLVSGPEAERAGLVSGFGGMGPGNWANVALGRAVALSYNLLLGVRPGAGDLSLQGSPAEFSYCVVENLADSPWPGYHEQLGAPSDTAVLVLKCEGPHNVLDNINTNARGVVSTVAHALHRVGLNNCYNPSAQTIVFLNPEHAKIVASDGWTVDDVRYFLYDTARSPRVDVLASGISPSWPSWFWAADRIPIVTSPNDIIVVVTGAPGPQSQVAVPWGYSRGVVEFVSGDSNSSRVGTDH
ncbi:UGSC family (seleno)protein [Actinophytocola sp.]|uniref:UGSC family (seleno)protein n=1 Tax=Actinophytocola sp. TaxID=1872138 RepID=UPI003D6AF0A5